MNINAMTANSPPQRENEIKGFLGRVQYISPFIPKLTMAIKPYYEIGKKVIIPNGIHHVMKPLTILRNT